MKDFQDLDIISTKAGAELPKHLIAACSPPWTFDEESSNRLTRSIGTECYRFESSGDSFSKAAWLSLARKSGDTFYVSNLGPAKPGQFDRDEYNAVLNSFIENVVSRVPEDAGFLPLLGSDRIDLPVILGAEAMAILRSFSASANRNALHPNDRERLYDFISHVHRHSIDLDGSTLERWLVEDGGWAEVQASDVHDLYSSSLELLRRYDPRDY